MRHALLRIGAVGLASAVTAVVLFGIGRLILIGDLGIAMPPPSQASASPSPTISPAVLSDVAAPKPSPTPTATPEPSPTPSEAPLALSSFAFLGHSYVGIIVPEIPRTFVAPFAGIQGSVTEVLAADGTPVGAGDPLFRLVTAGRSSWATFYNSSAPYQVVVSLPGVPSGRDLDPTPLL